MVEEDLKVFENRLLSIIYRSKGEELNGGRRKLRKEELHGFCCASIIRTIKLRRMR
jgi:hypothetical protein